MLIFVGLIFLRQNIHSIRIGISKTGKLILLIAPTKEIDFLSPWKKITHKFGHYDSITREIRYLLKSIFRLQYLSNSSQVI